MGEFCSFIGWRCGKDLFGAARHKCKACQASTMSKIWSAWENWFFALKRSASRLTWDQTRWSSLQRRLFKNLLTFPVWHKALMSQDQVRVPVPKPLVSKGQDQVEESRSIGSSGYAWLTCQSMHCAQLPNGKAEKSLTTSNNRPTRAFCHLWCRRTSQGDLAKLKEKHLWTLKTGLLISLLKPKTKI